MQTVDILVRDFAQSRGVDLTVNGRKVHIPVGKQTPIDVDLLPALRDAGVPFEEVSAEAVKEQAEAPVEPAADAIKAPVKKPAKKPSAAKA